jgi:hypothetical protein
MEFERVKCKDTQELTSASEQDVFLLLLLDQQSLQSVSSGKVLSLLGLLELGLGFSNINFNLIKLRHVE